MSKITAEQFDEMFDNGDDIDAYVDWSKARTGSLGEDLLLLKLPVETLASVEKLAVSAGKNSNELIAEWIEIKLHEYQQAAE